MRFLLCRLRASNVTQEEGCGLYKRYINLRVKVKKNPPLIIHPLKIDEWNVKGTKISFINLVFEIDKWKIKGTKISLINLVFEIDEWKVKEIISILNLEDYSFILFLFIFYTSEEIS